MKAFKSIIKDTLKEYEDTIISVTTVERNWDDRLKDWVEFEVKHTGKYRGILFRNDSTEIKIKLMDEDGKMKTYPINMSSEFEF